MTTATCQCTVSLCVKCGVEKPVSEFHKDRRRKSGIYCYCKTCKTEIDRDKYNKRGGRSALLKRTYGISEEEYDAMYASQGGACKICGKNFSKLNVDHCHSSGDVRGLLCHHCNTMLGLAKDNISILQNAITYLSKHRSMPNDYD